MSYRRRNTPKTIASKLGWTQKDRHEARREGWRIIDAVGLGDYCYITNVEFGRHPDNKMRGKEFPSLTYYEANALVREKAEQFSRLHERALWIVTRSKMESKKS